MRKIDKKILTSSKKRQFNLFKCEIVNKNEEIEKIIEKEQNSNNMIIKNGSVGTTETKLTNNTQDTKSNKFYQKCARKRQQKGMIILSEKVENKIYKLKRALRKKGLDPNEIKDIINRKRRDEENKYRKDLKQLCFKCREPGHSLANCPNNQGTDTSSDICYFCGSSEHRLSDCSKYKSAGKNDKNLPYAKCFLCNQMGHLTRSCNNNSKGIFPNGGKCLLCGSINHLVKDCDQNDAKQEDEILLKTYADLDYGLDTDDLTIIQTKSPTNANKIVKF